MSSLAKIALQLDKIIALLEARDRLQAPTNQSNIAPATVADPRPEVKSGMQESGRGTLHLKRGR